MDGIKSDEIDLDFLRGLLAVNKLDEGLAVVDNNRGIYTSYLTFT